MKVHNFGFVRTLGLQELAGKFGRWSESTAHGFECRPTRMQSIAKPSEIEKEMKSNIKFVLIIFYTAYVSTPQSNPHFIASSRRTRSCRLETADLWGRAKKSIACLQLSIVSKLHIFIFNPFLT